jgi:hypothetical protein
VNRTLALKNSVEGGKGVNIELEDSRGLYLPLIKG